MSDAQLLQRYREKEDADSFGILYDRYLHLVYGLCLKYLKDRDASQDAVMDIYELIAQKLKTQEVTHFKSWLYIVSKNHCLMQLRKANPEMKMEDHFMELAESAHHNDEPNAETDYQALEKCIDQLKDEQKHCVNEFYLQQRSYQEIAESAKLDLKKVKSYIQNGKRNLKICLEEQNVRR